jgi:hypothetical protein
VDVGRDKAQSYASTTRCKDKAMSRSSAALPPPKKLGLVGRARAA